MAQRELGTLVGLNVEDEMGNGTVPNRDGAGAMDARPGANVEALRFTVGACLLWQVVMCLIVFGVPFLRNYITTSSACRVTVTGPGGENLLPNDYQPGPAPRERNRLMLGWWMFDVGTSVPPATFLPGLAFAAWLLAFIGAGLSLFLIRRRIRTKRGNVAFRRVWLSFLWGINAVLMICGSVGFHTAKNLLDWALWKDLIFVTMAGSSVPLAITIWARSYLHARKAE